MRLELVFFYVRIPFVFMFYPRLFFLLLSLSLAGSQALFGCHGGVFFLSSRQ